MKKALYLLFIVLSWQVAKAVPPGDISSNTAFLTKAKDYINARLTHAILETDYVRARDKNNNLEIIKGKLEENSIDRPLAYNDLKDLLDKKFDLVDDKFSSQVNDIEVNQFEQASIEEGLAGLMRQIGTILENSYLDDEPNLSVEFRKAFDELKQAIPEKAPGNGGPVVDPVPANPTGGQPVEKTPDFFSMDRLSIWDMILVALLIGVSVYLFGEISRVTKESSHHRSDSRTYNRSQYEELTQVTSDDLRKVNNKLEAQQRLIDKLQSQLDDLKENRPAVTSHNYMRGEGSITDSTAADVAKQQTGNKRNPEPLETFFMVAPSYDYFPLNAKTSARETALYKFTVSRNKSEAKFEVINDGASVADAANYASTYFDPVCDAQNRPKEIVRKVKTSTPGTATFDGDKWVVQNKAVIVYE